MDSSCRQAALLSSNQTVCSFAQQKPGTEKWPGHNQLFPWWDKVGKFKWSRKAGTDHRELSSLLHQYKVLSDIRRLTWPH